MSAKGIYLIALAMSGGEGMGGTAGVGLECE